MAVEVIPLLDDLILFQSYARPIDLTFNQYLLGGSHPLLVHTGDRQMAGQLAERLVPVLRGRSLSYIFISHFESDECGGLVFWLREFPDAQPLCSEVTARQLSGFDITKSAVIRKPGETLETDSFALQFVSYPSEMHLWEGLVAFETRRRVLFSADLFIRRGVADPATHALKWEEEVEKISPMQVPSPEARGTLQETLRKLPVGFVAPGHGPFLKGK